MHTGPPEMTRDIVMAAAVAMESGDWRKCQEHIFSIKVWNLFSDKDTVLGMLSQKIREESLRTYLFVYSGFYESISLQTLRCVKRAGWKGDFILALARETIPLTLVGCPVTAVRCLSWSRRRCTASCPR